MNVVGFSSVKYITCSYVYGMVRVYGMVCVCMVGCVWYGVCVCMLLVVWWSSIVFVTTIGVIMADIVWR